MSDIKILMKTIKIPARYEGLLISYLNWEREPVLVEDIKARFTLWLAYHADRCPLSDIGGDKGD